MALQSNAFPHARPPMNLLAIIVVLLAVAICLAIAYIAWELSSDEPRPPPADGAAGDDPPER
ncbi:MAG TPA: hypothetical protein VKZ85_13345 [Woeseiaceae bacterium]|nr:hypothetical protein [Woeseiaceae bacterium]